MKTREQLLYEMAVTVHETVLAGTFDTTEKLLDLVVGACEEVVASTYSKDYSVNKILENLKKLKSK